MLYPKRFSNSNRLFSRAGKASITSKPEKELKKEIIEKLILRFDKLHKRQYILSDLIKSLNKILDSIKTPLNKFNLDKEFSSIEPQACKILNISPFHNSEALNVLNSQNLPSISMESERDPILSVERAITTTERSFPHDFIPLRRKTDLQKEKEKDEWAKLASLNLKNYLDEMGRKKQEQELKQKKMREDLEMQITDRRLRLQKKDNSEDYYNSIQAELNKQYDRSQSEKKESHRKQVQQMNEIRESQIKVRKEQNQIELSKRKHDEIQMIEQGKKEEELLRKQALNKKLNERISFHNIMLEDKESQKLKILHSKNSKIDDLKYNEHNVFIKEHPVDQFSPRSNPEMTDKLKIAMTPLPGKKRAILKNLGDEKYLREEKEKEEKLLKAEQEIKARREKKIKEMQESLEKQIQEKNKIKEEIANINRKYEAQIKSDLEKFKLNLEEKSKSKKEKVAGYIKELKQQIDDRFNSKQLTISETERKLNRGLLRLTNA